MGCILAIDYGTKRCGIAVTDDLQIIASALDTVETSSVLSFLKNYIQANHVTTIVIGQPKRMHGQDSDVEKLILKFIEKLKKTLPSDISIERYDERFTSKLAFDTLLSSGVSKKRRQDKGVIDRISATLILQGYLDSR